MISRLHTRRINLFCNVMELVLLTNNHNLSLYMFMYENGTTEMIEKSNFLSLIRAKNDFDK